MSLQSGKIPCRDRIKQRLYDWKRAKYKPLFPDVDPDPYKTKKDLEKADADNLEEATLMADIITEEIHKWFLDAKKEIKIAHVTLHEGTPWTESSLPISAGIQWE